MSDLKLFSGNATPELANEIAKCLYTNLADATVDKFSDGEVHVQINECVRGCDTFIIQSTCAPTNDNLMELLVMVDALRRASAGRITAVIPYFGYARQDRRVRSARVPITAKVVADLLSSVGVDRVLTVDLHAEQIQGFFDVPVDNCYSSKLFVEDIKNLNLENPCIVSPDMGGVVRARAISKLLNDAPIAIIDKWRYLMQGCCCIKGAWCQEGYRLRYSPCIIRRCLREHQEQRNRYHCCNQHHSSN